MPRLQRGIGLLMVTILLLTGFGCKGLSVQEAEWTKPVTLEYWTVFDDVDAIQELATQFQKDHPFITIKIKQMRSSELYDNLVEALADDQGPDMISVRNTWLGKFESKLSPMPATIRNTTLQVQRGQFSTQTIVNTQNNPGLTTTQLDREYVQAVKQDVVRNGKIYGLPLSMDTLAMYYNKDLLDRAQIAEPPKDWKEFQSDVKKLTKIDKTSNKIVQSGVALGTGNNVPGSEDILYVLFKQSQLPFADQNGRATFNQITQNTPQGELTPAMQVIGFYSDFANSARDTYTWNESMENGLERFINGSVGFYVGHSYDYPIIKARSPQLNFDVMPMLQLSSENPVNVASYWVQSVVAKSKHPDEAWNFLTYITHSSATKQYLDRTGRPAALRALVAGQIKAQDVDTAPTPNATSAINKHFTASFASQVLVADTWYKGRDYEAATKSINDLLHEWLMPSPDPQRDIEWKQTILDRAAAKVNQTY